MPKPNQPSKSRSSDEILREMEAMTSDNDTPSPRAETSSGGGLKAFLDFFVKVVPEENEAPAVNSTASTGTGGTGKVPVQAAHQAAKTTGPRVADLVAGEAAPKFAAPATTAADLSQRPLDEIYREAGISDSPCSVDELARLMENPAVANHPLNIKVVAVNLALSAKGVSQEVPIADAVRRDRALDAYQQMLIERARQAEQRNRQKIEQLTRETEEFLKQKQAEIEALRADITEVKRQSDDFSLRREVEEKRLAELVGPFLEGKPNPVSVGN
ncbi:MAG: hypothetical protein ACRD82_06375 [Blastocatellia bacterium]